MARQLSYMCAKHNIIPFNHFSGVKGKSAKDAALTFTHDLQVAHNHGFVASSLTYDIQGFFDNVSHPVLLSTMRKKCLPIAAILWTKAFLSHRCTIICLDGRRDKIRDIEMGIPQGSPVSPILAALLTSTLRNSDDTPLYLKRRTKQRNVDPGCMWTTANYSQSHDHSTLVHGC
jgi:hypothetical protein